MGEAYGGAGGAPPPLVAEGEIVFFGGEKIIYIFFNCFCMLIVVNLNSISLCFTIKYFLE